MKNIANTKLQSKTNLFYKICLVLFILSLLLDNNRITAFGYVPTAIMVGLLIIVSLPILRVPTNSPIPILFFFITFIVLLNLIFRSQSIVSAYTIVGPLALCFTIAYTGGGLTDIYLQIKVVLLVIFTLTLPYYIAIINNKFLISRYSPLGFNSNIIAITFCFGINIAFYIKDNFNGFWKIISFVFIILVIPPLVFSGSRKGIVILIFSLLFLFTLYNMKIKLFKVVILTEMLLVILFLFSDFLPKIHFNFTSKLFNQYNTSIPIKRFNYEYYSRSVDFRRELVQRGISLAIKKPFIGYGIDSIFSKKFLIEKGLVNRLGFPIGTHNGLLNYIILSGMPFLICYLLLFIYLFRKLYMYILYINEEVLQKLSILSLSMLNSFLLFIPIGGGAEFWKMGWWSIGFAILIITILQRIYEYKIY